MQGKRQTSHFLIGLFVTIGVVMGVVAVIWLGASQYFQKGKRYVSYFDESVQGLSVDSSVKYRGVEVGRVERIDVAPDNRLIEVIMKIDLEEDFAKDTISQLKSVGITGLVFIELNRRDEGQAKRMVEIDFEAPYPVIPSIESDLSRIVSTIDQAISRIKEIDVQDTLEKVKSIANAVESVVTDGRLRNIMTNLDTSAARFSGVTEEMEKTLSETRTALSKANMLIDESRSTIDDMELAETASSFKDAAAEMKAALAEAQKLIADSRKVVKEMELAERSKDAEVLMEDLDSSARMAAVGIRDAGESVERAARALELFVQRLSENPSDILFGRPPRERRER